MIKKLSILFALLVIITGMIVFIVNFDSTNNFVYANSISVKNKTLSICPNDCILNSELGITILPKNYNQSITYTCSNTDCVYFDKQNNLHATAFTGNATINIFVKSSEDKTIFASINIIINDSASPISNKESFIENDYVEFEQSGFAINKLTLLNNPNVSVSYKNNLVTYNYLTGKVQTNANLQDNNNIYDEVNILLTYSNRATQLLNFKVVVVKIVNLLVKDSYCLEYNNTSSSFYQNEHLIDMPDLIEITPLHNKTLVYAKEKGIAFYTINGENFTYKTKFIIM